jgi:hypothetical protein
VEGLGGALVRLLDGQGAALLGEAEDVVEDPPACVGCPAAPGRALDRQVDLVDRR